MSDCVPNKLRPYLWRLREHLGNLANRLWDLSEEIHHRQNREGDPNKCGRYHAVSVEHNIWRLLFDPQNPSNRLSNNKENFGDYDIFLLSAAACCHDFDKAVTLPDGLQHGEHSADIVYRNMEYFNLNDNQVEDINSVISIHAIDDTKQFRTKLRELPIEKEYEHGTFNLQRLALLLKAADILHLDRSRISQVIESISDYNGLSERSKHKVLFRSHTRGWGIRSSAIHIEATVEHNVLKQRRTVQKSFDWIKKNEWSSVEEHLEPYGFACKLELDLKEVKDGKIISTSPGTKKQLKFIPVRAKRYIQMPQAEQLLYTALNHDAMYPLCRNAYTSHAAGTAVARICVLIMFDMLQTFKRTFVTDVNEFSLESECIITKLSEHITRFSNTRSMLRHLSHENELYETLGNSLKASISELPEGNTFFKSISDFQKAFDEHLEDIRQHVTINIAIIERLTDVEQENAVESPEWLLKTDPNIQNWFRQKKRDLVQLSNEFDAPFEVLREMLSYTQEDWNKDATLIYTQEEGNHRPYTGN